MHQPKEPGGWASPASGSVRVAVALIGFLLLGELGARAIGPEIPRRAGSEERAFLKADQMAAIGAHRTDVAIIGSSESAGGLVPSVLAAQAPELHGFYNAALAGTYQPVQQEWAERVVVPTLRPKVVVIGLLPMAVWAHDERIPDPNADAQPAYRSAIDQLDPGHLGDAGRWLRAHSALVRYRPYLRRPVPAIQGAGRVLGLGAPRSAPADDRPFGMDWKTETDPAVVRANTAPTGEVLDYRSRSLPTAPDPTYPALFAVIATGRVDFGPLGSLVASLRRQGTTPVLALGPIDREVLLASGVDLRPFDDLVDTIEAWAAERDLPVLDSSSRTWSADDFHDRTHVDEAGSRRWSTEVGRWLGELCRSRQLPDACGPRP